MRNRAFFAVLCAAVAACAQAATAQPPDAVERAEPIVKREYKLVAPIVSSAEAQKLALPDDIQIHLQNVTLLRALQELEKQSGLQFDYATLDRKNLDAKISIDVDTPSFTRALDAIADEAALKLTLSHGQVYDRWHVRTHDDKAKARFAPESVDGLFAARLVKIDVLQFKQFDLDAEKPARTQNDNLNLTLELTPDLGWPISGLPVLRATKAVDEQGRSLIDVAATPKKMAYDAGFQDIWSKKNAILQLLPPAADARKIAHLEGEALYMIALKYARWEVPDLLANKTPTYNFNIGDTPVVAKISGAKIEADDVRFDIEFTLPPRVSWLDFSGNTYTLYGVINWMSIEDANGTRLIANGEGGGSGSNRFNSRARFSLPPDQKGKAQLKSPLNFVFKPPTDWIQARAQFKFEDVPLP